VEVVEWGSRLRKGGHEAVVIDEMGLAASLGTSEEELGTK